MSTKSNFTLVVADDFSDTGALALSESLRMAHFREAELHVVHVVTDQDLEAAEGGNRIEKQDQVMQVVPRALWERIAEVGTNLQELAELHITVHVRLGSPPEAINQTAADYGADVIIVGHAGRQGVQRLILGSVAEKLIKSANCPVLVARAKDYSGMRKSERPEPPRPGEDLHAERPRRSHTYTSTQRINFRDSETMGAR